MTINNGDEFTQKLVRGFTIIERKHRKYMNHSLSQDGINNVAYSYVIIIKKNPGISQDNLADELGVNKSRVARIVRDLETVGYITREPSPGNRRQYMLKLTGSGEDLYKVIIEKSIEWGNYISLGIDEKDKESIIRIIDKILDNLDEKKVRQL